MEIKDEVCKDKSKIFKKMDVKNSERLSAVFLFFILLAGGQVLLYSRGNMEFYGYGIFYTKIFMLVGGILLLFPLWQIKKENKVFLKYSQMILYIAVFLALLLSILNSFYAQQISSDMSIYIMALFSIVASVRLRPLIMLSLLSINYTIFAVGIGFFQTNLIYQFSHIVNGAIMNMIAFIISIMFYHYSIKTYEDELDISLKNLELKKLSERDGLTDLYNHRAISNILEVWIEEEKINKGKIYLGMIDIDNFKHINDKYGHSFGDEVLKQIADKIKENLRPNDVACRYGGDEFVILLKNISGDEVRAILQKILSEVRTAKFIENNLSFSCGVAKWNGEVKDELFERADGFMYQVKNAGKDNFMIEI